jgi:hypothetical protein
MIKNRSNEKRNPSKPKEEESNARLGNIRQSIITVIHRFLERNHQFFTTFQTSPTISKFHGQPHQTHQVVD